MKLKQALILPALCTIALVACGGASTRPSDGAAAAQEAPLMTGPPSDSRSDEIAASANSAANSATEATAEDGCVSGLPFARGAVFCSLDDYLAHLERQGAIDLPWWRQVRPGIYERVVRMAPAPERETATREELMRRFGFRR
jgi:hypothetical protein